MDPWGQVSTVLKIFFMVLSFEIFKNPLVIKTLMILQILMVAVRLYQNTILASAHLGAINMKNEQLQSNTAVYDLMLIE